MLVKRVKSGWVCYIYFRVCTKGEIKNNKVAKQIINNLISFNIFVSNKIGENTKNTKDNKPKVIYKE